MERVMEYAGWAADSLSHPNFGLPDDISIDPSLDSPPAAFENLGPPVFDTAAQGSSPHFSQDPLDDGWYLHHNPLPHGMDQQEGEQQLPTVPGETPTLAVPNPSATDDVLPLITNGTRQEKAKGRKSGSSSNKKGKGTSHTTLPPTPAPVGDDQATTSPSTDAAPKHQDTGKRTKNVEAGGRVIATKPTWSDITTWSSPDTCPLMSLPPEVLDMCFGLRPDLAMRDYISLAGVSAFFRHHLDDAFFKALKGSRCPILKFTNTALPTQKYEYDPIVASHPFSRDIPPWRVPRPPSSLPPDGLPAGIVPPGPRATWSQAEYEAYKLAKWDCRHSQKESIRAKWEGVTRHARDMANSITKIPRNGRQRTVKAVILGRRDGEVAVQKDGWGYPVPVDRGVGLAAPLTLTSASSVGEGVPAQATVGTKRGVPDDNDEGESPKKKEKSSKARNKSGTAKRKAKSRGKKKWTVPETDYESDLDDAPIYDAKGNYMPHEYWPSAYRAEVAALVNDTRIGKTEAIKTYKVKEAEVITLKHVLLSNPLNQRCPQQLFVEAAVESLAFRAHGGAAGHATVMDNSKKRSDKIADTREKKDEIAKANGTYVPKVHRPFIPPWEFHYRASSFYTPDGFWLSPLFG